MIVPGIRFVQGANDYADGDGRKYGIAIHNTSNDASDEGEAAYAARRTDGVSSHLYCDADSVTQSIDTNDKCGHAGSAYGNENAIAVEITGANGMSRDWWLANVAWDKLGAVLAAVIKHHWPDGSFRVRRASAAEMKANPKVKAFYSHDDMRRAWGGTTHTDPGPNFPWDKLFAVVNAALNGDDDMTPGELLGTKLGASGPIVAVALQDTYNNVKALQVAAAADETRDKAHQAAIEALAAAVAAGGGSVDAVGIIAEVRAAGERTGAVVTALQAEVADLKEQLADRDARLAAALAGGASGS